MRLIFLLTLNTYLLSFHSQSIKDLSIGEQVTFNSRELNEERTLNIYLPYGYHPDSSQTYPVIYLLDGSMHEDMLHISGLVQFCSYSWINLIPECIVVGISNVNRYRDFTFIPQNKEYLENDPRRGGSDKFIRYLETEVITYMDKNYKTNENKVIIGQSLGGLLATQILFEKPTLFNHYYIVSPSLWYDDEALLSKPIPENNQLKGIFVAVGKEGKIMVSEARKLAKILTKKYGSDKVIFDFFSKHDHGDVLHNSIYLAFQRIGYKLKN
ncbi:MAG: alpha/beta hydrolase [Flavobacteriales bacterium]|nr:alpha/beta hydrolase [Flavobacteriales bacterium]